MTAEETAFRAIGDGIDDAEASQMFGKPCYTTGGKAFICFFQNEMVFKLNGDAHKEALSLDGATLFDPSGKGRAMKEWVQVPALYLEKWEGLARAAKEYVKR
jgi:hypothetical protein